MLKRSLIGVLPGVLALLVWHGVLVLGLADPALLPPVGRVAVALRDLLVDPAFYAHLQATMLLLAKGFFLSLLIGAPLGTLLGLSPSSDRAFSVYVDFLRALPAAALIPVCWVFLSGDTARVIVLCISGSLVFVVACRSGVRSVEPARLEMVTLLRLSPLARFRKLLVWEMLSELMVGARLALSLVFVLATVIEMLLGAQFGLGDQLLNASSSDKPRMFALIIVLGMVGYLLGALMNVAERMLRRYGYAE